MNTFMLKNKINQYTSVSNVFIDKYMISAPGEYVKVYLLGLRHCLSGEIGISASEMSTLLNLLESDILKAWTYWNTEGVVDFKGLATPGNYAIEFLDLYNISQNDQVDLTNASINILQELSNTSIQDMMQDIEKLLGRTLSNKEIHMYLNWQKEYSFSPEMILLLIQYCTSKGKSDYRYIETVAIAWHDAKIKDIDEAQSFIKKREDVWIKIRKILKYLGFNSSEVMKPQEDMLIKWLNTYNFPLDVIYKACDICFERLNKAEFKYIDGILNSWYKENIRTIEDVDMKDRQKPKYVPNKNKYSSNSKPDTFSNRKQRSYDLDKIEKTLLGWDEND
ncbi:DnaD domain protein [Clostridium grantii]|uniref:DnaD and phage-associated domain-containing protein n=1 Tax=Clostridium grantii DSM 8605 TaxID=1121316 RepID=A0A1M5W416_9CLOT|nr:DnaD domain protein [Clostridium grantii]SHH82227.1 DnaD and phage-associated domain-containing protein [Clostridium grantii DSM 8605]